MEIGTLGGLSLWWESQKGYDGGKIVSILTLRRVNKEFTLLKVNISQFSCNF